MTEREQLNLKVKTAKKEKWAKYQEDNPEYSSMTDLIRQSVEKEIVGTHEPDSSPSNAGTDKEVAELKDMVRSMQNDVDTLTSVVSDLQRTVKADPSDKHLRSEIFAALPSVGSMQGPVTPEELAEDLGPIDESVVANVLENMSVEIGAVEKIIGANDSVKYQKKD